MQNQYINEWFNIPELHVNQILFSDGDELHLEAVPVAQRQCCPVCQSMQHVIRKGNNGRRIVRHLSVFEKKTFLNVPALRLQCSACEVGFGWMYEFVGPKQRYSKLFRTQTVEQVLGSTAAHSARMQQTPASTVLRFHHEAIPELSDQIQKQAWAAAKITNELIFGVDDFAIKGAHLQHGHP
nr:transposase family protein [Paenibacillus pinihumi]